MEAPVLTQEERKQSMSWWKNKQQSRTVIASPYERYWPVLDGDAEDSFNELLLQTLEPLRMPTVKVNWSKVRKLPKEKRKEVRRKLLESKSYVSEKSRINKLRACLFFGLNAVAKGLDSAGVSAVILGDDADPKLLISHVLSMCGMKHVPVLLVPSLRRITKTGLGFSCLALAVKKVAEDHFRNLCEMVSSLSSKIPVPEPLKFHGIVAKTETKEEPPEQEVMTEIKEEPLEQEVRVVNISADVYKHRTSKSMRAFVPGDVPKSKPSEDFLSINMDVEDVIDTTPTFSYRPVKIKTFTPNPDKVRKRELKKRKK